jgi:hypothetical protein
MLRESLFRLEIESDIKKSNKNIFFMETSFKSNDGSFVMNARSACSVESAARMNPNSHIYVFFTANKPFKEGSSDFEFSFKL